MHIHILGICGTFMGGVAALAKSLGHKVTGSDANVYPPMSTQLEALGIELVQGYDPSQLEPAPDLVVIGNAMSRGNPAVEYTLEHGLPYMSGPQWLGDYLLRDRWVLAVAGTHGKTTTASMLAWILEDAGIAPGFLIGGVPGNFNVSARLGDSPFFVVEADEYDSAFFDKRSKFVHYHPRTLVMNNLEFDHADIFDDLKAIKRQFHHLVRTVPGSGQILWAEKETALADVIKMGCWSEQQVIGSGRDWDVANVSADGSQFDVLLAGELVGQVNWPLIGRHNVDNGLMAIAAARHVGVTPDVAVDALSRFVSPKRRMELKAEIAGVAVYDDFAHHPTAITTTLNGLRAKVGKQRILAILEPRSNTMKLGIHKQELAQALQQADQVFLFQPPGIEWSLEAVAEQLTAPVQVHQDVDALAASVLAEAAAGDQLLVMSNGGFGGLHNKLIAGLQAGVIA
ncbi:MULTISPECIES: UDP-N-acetylmuramate:L-alanyl-gamma-D-glutamyl-meso-diaminopimelate ligase [Corallincola]|uniref:UDP-N-acetylmuramate--L-alanyl-gamma-D-glutamyl-meso-2,6-diaminoheptandioate ligase n=2 Tax=Corallincola TaxID=1775176 RepID=A0A368NQ51_9GAMM|nr:MULTISPECIES: UDP-N-acetylmuramate:L-alanyl-gamma-D-glutamyl-meso-diaminopimelate ligase [Corallincola]RCU51599.1 UDP-N-acetylmuramate:L-alanyl-gamma-D-glutamyl-meso-diaminopimelate ligase [Corallincola holothuriorum]TAA47101.1 UDP-N-acetylmuramate:L-alanyl-gamma-D-glutamyl-meso-diaminopimelate ligase [Corallincola spongiicola]